MSAGPGTDPAVGSSVLDRILHDTRVELERRMQEHPTAELERLLEAHAGRDGSPAGAPAAFRDALSAPGLTVIAEIKRRAPSAGELREIA
ncbi:MAG: hypothetical protein KGJ43_06480, partial [Acidobacteriota bacterium]|nr:hypothetical protein [Acidobacteriota bacterium]